MKATILYYLIKLILSLLALLSLPTNHKLGTILGKGLYFFNTKARKISEINISLCMPELSADEQSILVKNSLIELGKSISELGAIWLWNIKKLFSHLQVEGESIVQAAIKDEQGVIILSPHIGCWEIVGLYLGQQWQTPLFYQPPKIKSLDSIIQNARTRSGGHLLATNKRGLGDLLKALKAGKVTGILPDQTPKKLNSGTFAPFFNQPALTINLISKLAKKSNAIVLMTFATRLPNGEGYVLHFQQSQLGVDSADALIATTALNQSVEQIINQLPEQYLWSYKRFKKVPEGLDKNY